MTASIAASLLQILIVLRNYELKNQGTQVMIYITPILLFFLMKVLALQLFTAFIEFIFFRIIQIRGLEKAK